MTTRDSELDSLLSPLMNHTTDTEILARWTQAVRSQAQLENLSLRRRKSNYVAGLIAASVIGLFSGLIAKDMFTPSSTKPEIAIHSPEKNINHSATVEFVYDKID